MPKVSLNPNQVLISNIQKLKNECVFSAITGNYKNFKEASKRYADIAVDNFELCKNVKGSSANVPLFSKAGFNMFKVWFLNKFRSKTPNEKLLYKMGKEEKLKQKYLR